MKNNLFSPEMNTSSGYNQNTSSAEVIATCTKNIVFPSSSFIVNIIPSDTKLNKFDVTVAFTSFQIRNSLKLAFEEYVRTKTIIFSTEG